MVWLEISLTVDGELTEAVAEVLSRYAPDGVVVESTGIQPETTGEGRVVGPLRVYAYLPVDAALDGKRQRLEEALWHLGQIRPLPQPQYRPVQETDWAESWKRHFQPLAIGRRLLILPPWAETSNPGHLVVRIEPGMAFGTGAHPSTQLCLEIIEAAIDARPKTSQGDRLSLIDLGCGSGVLAVAALKLGAQRALGVDTDPQALEVSRNNALANGVADHLELGHGSLAEILAGRFSIRRAELVVVNILAPVLVRLLEQGLEQLLLPDGRLVLAGILEEQAGQVERTAVRQGLRLVEHHQSGDWVALVCGNYEL